MKKNNEFTMKHPSKLIYAEIIKLMTDVSHDLAVGSGFPTIETVIPNQNIEKQLKDVGDSILGPASFEDYINEVITSGGNVQEIEEELNVIGFAVSYDPPNEADMEGLSEIEKEKLKKQALLDEVHKLFEMDKKMEEEKNKNQMEEEKNIFAPPISAPMEPENTNLISAPMEKENPNRMEEEIPNQKIPEIPRNPENPKDTEMQKSPEISEKKKENPKGKEQKEEKKKDQNKEKAMEAESEEKLGDEKLGALRPRKTYRKAYSEKIKLTHV